MRDVRALLGDLLRGRSSRSQSDVCQQASQCFATPSGTSVTHLRGERHVPVVDRPAADVDDRLRVVHGRGSSSTGSRPMPMMQIAVLDERPLDGARW